MYSYIFLALILISSISSSNALSYTITKDKYNIAGLPMQFNITVSDSAYPFYYKFELSENITNSTIILTDDKMVTKNYIFPKITKSDNYTLRVQVYFMFEAFKIMKVNGPSHIDFEVRDQLNGIIKFNQDNLRQSALKKSYVACFNPINFKSEIDDFHNNFQKVTFNWFINGTILPNVTTNQLNHTLKEEKIFNITTTFNATSQDNLQVTGRTELILKAFRPLDNLNLTGIPNISFKRNKNLVIYVNFVNGTKPYWFCYQIFSDDKIKLICNDPLETMQDYFKVTKRFSRNGTYYLKIKAGNEVTKLEKSFPISVIEFEKKFKIIFIIVPIASIISILVMTLFAITFYTKSRAKFKAEVADFDFEQLSQVDNLNEEVFFERLKNAFKNSIKGLLNGCDDEQTLINRLESVNNIDDDQT